MASRQPKLAIAYDFDRTLAPGNMQDHTFISDIGMIPKDFWKEVQELAKQEQCDEILVYMTMMLEKANEKEMSLTKSDWARMGAKIELFEGVNEWFSNINQYGKNSGVKVEHYLISSGIKEILEGTSIASYFNRIYASQFRYDVYDRPIWPSMAVNYSTKTQFIFRINKGALDAHDAKGVNIFVDQKDRPIPFENIIYVGDGDTDVPCFRIVKDNGGLAIAVYQAGRKGDLPARKKTVEKFKANGRVDVVAKASYEPGSIIHQTVLAKIDAIAAHHKLRKLAA